MKNEILTEVWRNRDAFAKRCNYSLRRMVQALQEIKKDPRNPLVHGKNKSANKGAQSPRRLGRP